MANEIVPDNISKALNQIDRLRRLIVDPIPCRAD